MDCRGHELVDLEVLRSEVRLNRSIEECISKCVRCGRLFRVTRYYENSELVSEKCKEVSGNGRNT